MRSIVDSMKNESDALLCSWSVTCNARILFKARLWLVVASLIQLLHFTISFSKWKSLPA